MKFDGIIFDIDGTLWDTTGIVAEAWNKSINKIAPEQKLVTADILKKEFGKTMKAIADDLFKEIEEDKKNMLLEDCCREENYAIENNHKDITYEGVRETVRKIAGMVPVFIVSNCHKGYIEKVIEKNGFENLFQDYECFGNNGKNKDENIRLVVERNGLKRPVYVGDTAGDAFACRKADVPFIWASYGFGQVDEEMYMEKIGKISDLMKIIK